MGSPYKNRNYRVIFVGKTAIFFQNVNKSHRIDQIPKHIASDSPTNIIKNVS